MLKHTFLFILLILFQAYGICRKPELGSTLKKDYYKEMAANENADPELRIIWYDSLLNVSDENLMEIQLKKITLLREAGYTEKALLLTDNLIKQNRKLPLHHRLPLLYSRAACRNDSRNFSGAISDYTAILDMPKPDSLKYWDVRTGIALFTVYDELNDKKRSEDWLRKIESMLATYPLTPDFRRDAEGRCHGSRAVILIDENNLDSAYKEVKLARELGTSDQAQVASLIQTAQIYLAKGQTEAARQYINRALDIKINGQSRRTALYLLALCCIQEKKFAEALSVLDSYPAETVKVNSMGNLRAYYILRGQAYAGTGNLVLAYNSLDSALVAGDSITAKIKSFQSANAEELIQAQKECAETKSKLTSLSIWCMALGVFIMIVSVAVVPLLIANRKLRRKLLAQRSQINQARIDTRNRQLSETRNRENEDNMNRRQTALLLRLAHLESALDVLKKKLSTDELDKKSRDAILRQLHEINGKEKMWELFSMQFEMTNRKFLDLLSERHPTMSKSEKRICAFMLINLSTKEIAELLGRSPRTVDVTKYNIRKKLATDLPTEEYLRQLAAEANRVVE